MDGVLTVNSVSPSATVFAVMLAVPLDMSACAPIKVVLSGKLADDVELSLIICPVDRSKSL